MAEHVTTPSNLAAVASFIGIEFAAWRWVVQVLRVDQIFLARKLVLG